MLGRETISVEREVDTVALESARSLGFALLGLLRYAKDGSGDRHDAVAEFGLALCRFTETAYTELKEDE